MRWFTTKFAFAHKYQALWDEQCISGALLPYLTETELKDDVEMKSSIHRNGASSLPNASCSRLSVSSSVVPLTKLHRCCCRLQPSLELLRIS